MAKKRPTGKATANEPTPDAQEADLMRQFEERFILEFERALEDEMQRDPDFASHMGMV